MAGYSSYDDLLTETTVNGKVKIHSFFKTSTAPEAAGVMHSLWTAAGLPGAGAAPAATPGTAYDDASGSMFLQDEASDFKFLLSIEAMANQNCSLILYDRLVGVSGLSMVGTGNKTVSSTTLPRYATTTAAGNEAWLEVTTATTTTAAIVDMNSYTDQDGNTGADAPSVTFPAAATNIDAIVPLTLAAGDYGVRACSTINVNTAASAGVVNFLIVRRLATIPITANIGTLIDFVRGFPPMPRIFDGASLALALLASSTTAVTVQGKISFGWG